MDKPTTRQKVKKKKLMLGEKQKSAKKQKTDGPTCSMFLTELTRKLAIKNKLEKETKDKLNIVQSIIDTIAHALPIRLSKKSTDKRPTATKADSLNVLLSESNEGANVGEENISGTKEDSTNDVATNLQQQSKISKLPIVSSELFKQALEKWQEKPPMIDESVSTKAEHDVASEITRHVNTLKKISLIAEEFNQKTAKNLKEIVHSVQEELMKKIDEISTENTLNPETTSSVQIKP